MQLCYKTKHIINHNTLQGTISNSHFPLTIHPCVSLHSTSLFQTIEIVVAGIATVLVGITTIGRRYFPKKKRRVCFQNSLKAKRWELLQKQNLHTCPHVPTNSFVTVKLNTTVHVKSKQ